MESSEFNYVHETYNVPACFGRRVMVDGKPGIIVKDCGAYIGVNFDSAKPGVIASCHPTWKVEYLEIGTVRKRTRSQQRYDDYLRADSGLSFAEYIGAVK